MYTKKIYYYFLKNNVYKKNLLFFLKNTAKNSFEKRTLRFCNQ